MHCRPAAIVLEIYKNKFDKRSMQITLTSMSMCGRFGTEYWDLRYRSESCLENAGQLSFGMYEIKNAMYNSECVYGNSV